MDATIKILGNHSNKQQINIGENTMRFMDSQTKLDQNGKSIIVDEAANILSHCIAPGEANNITNIAVGYVQSGKTLSFTTLTALAADNGYRIVIYLTGTKTNLQNQTYNRLKSDLQVKKNKVYKIFPNINDGSNLADSISNQLLYSHNILLFPILKHYIHIYKLANIFSSANLKSILAKTGVIIIDDEADQSSFNTYAKKNAQKGEWEDDDFSQTYASIIALKKILPSHSYIQYTATPQAAFLIDNSDILSPKYHTVLTPGKGYKGGKAFFGSKNNMELVKIIQPTEIYHHKDNPLEATPKSLIFAIKEFLISVCIIVHIKDIEPFLSMMIHIDGRCDTNEKFSKWTRAALSWIMAGLHAPENDPGRISTVNSFKEPYNSITKYMTNPPSFKTVIDQISDVILNCEVHLVQSKGGNVSEEGISWDSAEAHILIGADMLNRGFTIEKLSMSYMPRTTKGKSNADTIEQRCRFFGYKQNYFDVCRIYLSEKSKKEYEEYVKHEEVLRESLKRCESIEEFTKSSKGMMLAESLNPTRTNILSGDLVRNKLNGWKQMQSLDCIEENRPIYTSLLHSLYTKFENCTDFGNNIIRCHRYAKMDIDEFITFFKQIKYQDVPNITRKIVTIQYLTYLKETQNKQFVYVYEMSYKAQNKNDLRERKIVDQKPGNLQAGYSKDGSYPGDIFFKNEDSLCIQIHHIKIKQPLDPLNGKDLYNICLYYPNQLATSFIELQDDDE